MRIPALDQINDLLSLLRVASNKGVKYPLMDNWKVKGMQDKIFLKQLELS